MYPLLQPPYGLHQEHLQQSLQGDGWPARGGQELHSDQRHHHWELGWEAQAYGDSEAARRTPPPPEPAAACHFQHPCQQLPPAGVLAQANRTTNLYSGAALGGCGAGGTAGTGRKAHAGGHPAAAAAARSSAALNECRRLNNRVRRCASAEELFASLADDWQSLDCINLSAALHRLAQLAEAAPGGPAAFCRAHLLGAPSWGWLLDQLQEAASAPAFGPQCVSNTLCALCKLDVLSPPLLRVLHAPLLRALGSAAAADRVSTRGLTQMLWCIGRDLPSLKPLVLAVKEPLLEALWAAAPALDAQGVATAWWALGELSSRCSPEEFNMEAEAPGLLPRMAAAARAVASGLLFQGLAQVLHACTKVRPRALRDEALLHTMASAAARRLQAGQEQPSLQAVGLICLAFGRLGFQPPCHWSVERGQHVSLLDELGAVLAAGLPSAQPQEVCNFVAGLGLLNHAPPASTLRALLCHLGSSVPSSAGGAGAPAAGGMGKGGEGEDMMQDDGHASDGASSGGGGGSDRCQVRPASCRQLALERFSSQELADLVCSLHRMLGGSGPRYPEPLLPAAAVEGFVDALDTVLAARASLATRFSPGARSDLALTGAHVGSIVGCLGRLAAIWPSAVLTELSLVELESHVLANPYSGESLASFLHYFALTGTQPGPQVVEAMSQRALAILHQRELPPALRQPRLAFTLAGLAKMLAALAALGINRPRLLCALLPAAAAALAEAQERMQAAVGGTPAGNGGGGSTRELVSLAAALGQLQAAGLLAPADLASPDVLLPLWHQLMWQLASTCSSGADKLKQQDAAVVQQAAGRLNQLSPGRGAFWLPPVVTGALAATHREHQHY